MSSWDKKYTNIAIVIVAVLILGVWGTYVYTHRNSKPSQPAQQAQTQGNTGTPATTPVDQATPPGTSTGSTAVSSYGAAVAAHPYRIQFTACHGNPGTLNVKKGTVVMLDNRDTTAHTVKADSQTFDIPGYGYVLLHTSTVQSINITCDGGGAALLNVEK